MAEDTDDNGAETFVPQSGPDRDEMASSYLPEQHDWMAKTALDLNDPQAIAALMQFGQMFPEVQDLQPIINEFSSDFMKARTSVEAQSREEYLKIITSMYGGSHDESNIGKFKMALGVDEDDD